MLAVVCDSTPLVYLSKLGQFGLLRRVYDQVLVPPAVWLEVAMGGAEYAESGNLKAAISEGWILIEPPKELDRLIGSFPKELGRGEMEAIALAREKRAVLVTDDSLGRAAAESLGLEVTGTIGVLLRAKQHGQLTAVRPLIEQLRSQTNFRISPNLYSGALRIAGEAEEP
jgi:uncharacterized protein